jgi:hypothetical protein
LSGYLAFNGGIIEEGMKKAGYAAKGTAIGKVYAITDGVISGVFDKQGNPDKSTSDVIGTAATAILMGKVSSSIGAFAGPSGAVWGEDFSEYYWSVTNKYRAFRILKALDLLMKYKNLDSKLTDNKMVKILTQALGVCDAEGGKCNSKIILTNKSKKRINTWEI